MIAVIFEVVPAEGRKDMYLDIASKLKPLLADIDGFISIERFQSLVDDKKVLSLSFWRDEKAIKAWRNLESHRFAQERGREDIFSDYRIRVASVERDYGLNNRKQAPSDSNLIHDNPNTKIIR